MNPLANTWLNSARYVSDDQCIPEELSTNQLKLHLLGKVDLIFYPIHVRWEQIKIPVNQGRTVTCKSQSNAVVTVAICVSWLLKI